MNGQTTSGGPFLALLFSLILSICQTPIFCCADTIQYQYDDLYRLIRTENPTTGNVVEYQYDAVGNRTRKTTLASGFPLAVTVRRDAQTGLAGVRTYLFSEAGSYLGLSQTTDGSGVATYDVSPGTYKVRADYLGYPFWSGTVPVAAATGVDLTIPHHPVGIAVNGSYQGSSTPLSGVKVYLFTPAKAYLSLHQTTAADGRVAFSLPAREYRVRADHLGQQYYSEVFHAQDAAVNVPLGEAEVTVLQASQPLANTPVYTFTAAGSYLGISGRTDAAGKVVFRLPAAGYKFRADHLGSPHWSEDRVLGGDQRTPIVIDTGGGSFALTVRKGASEPLAGASCYVFGEGGAYLGLSGKTDASGQVSFNLCNGSYKFRVDYLGYAHWSEGVAVPATLGLTRTIDHQPVTITVSGAMAGALQARSGLPVYLFTPAGSYLSLNGKTDGEGRVRFTLPQAPYKVRVDYLGQPFWSESFLWEDRSVLIPEGTGRVQVTLAGQPLRDVRVYTFSSGGAYLGLSGTTDGSGSADFRLPAGSYRFRADHQGNQYWASAAIGPDGVQTVPLSTGGGTFSLTVAGGSEPLTGVRVYLFSTAGTYLGLSGSSDAAGGVSFPLADGSYKFRADHLGYAFWSDPYTVPGSLAGTLSIPHQTRTITVAGGYPASQPLAGVKVYLFTPSGSYLGRSGVTDAGGQTAFSLPNQAYRVRADYLGYPFWAEVAPLQNTTVAVPHGLAQVSALKGGQPLAGAQVYLFSSGGAYLGRHAATDAEGRAAFALPARAYRFRVDAGGAQHWSETVTVPEGQALPVAVVWE